MSVTNGFIKITSTYKADDILPYPAVGLSIARSQFVDSSRNANGEIVAQKINRRIMKFDSLEWKHLTATEWRNIQKHIECFEGTIEFWDNLSGTFKKIKVYWGDESADIWKINPETGEVLEYSNCQCNLIDMGYAMT